MEMNMADLAINCASFDELYQQVSLQGRVQYASVFSRQFLEVTI